MGIEIPGIDQDPVEGGEDENPDEDPDVPSEPDTPAITMEWPANPEFDEMLIANGMDVNLSISAPAGISTFIVSVDSPTLNTALEGIVGSTRMDLISDQKVKDFLGGQLGLPTGDQLQGQSSVQFPLSNLVPMILTLGPDAGSRHMFTLEISDNYGESFSRTLTFYVAE